MIRCSESEMAERQAMVGKAIRILHMEGEDHYDGRVGKVELVDDSGQLHGTWGGLAVQLERDQYELLG